MEGTSSLSLDDLFARVGQPKTKERKKPKTYSRITRDEAQNWVVHIVVPHTNKSAEEVTPTDYKVVSLGMGKATREQEVEEFGNSSNAILRRLKKEMEEKEMYKT